MNNPIPNGGVTQRDLARALGLDHSTVSLALRDSPKITEARRRQIQEAAEKMGYRPNPAAAALARFKRQSTAQPIQAALAWLNLWPDPKKLRSFREFDLYWRGALAAAEKLGYRLEEFVCNEQLPVSKLQTILAARGIHGILLPPHPFQPDWNGFPFDQFSVVRFGRS